MSLLSDSITLYTRELLIFKANLRTNIMRSVMFPFVIILFFGSIGAIALNTPIAIVNYANNPQSLSLISSLGSTNNVKIYTITDQNTALKLLQDGKVQAVVVILPTFPSMTPNVPGVQLYYSTIQSSSVTFAVQYITNTANRFGAVSQQGNLTVQKQSGQVTPIILYGTKGSYKDFLTAGILGMIVVFTSIFSGGIAFISDRQLGNVKMFLITPISKNAIVLSKVFAGATFSLISAFLALGIGVLLGAKVAMQPIEAIPLIAVTVGVLGAGFSSLAMIIATKVKKVDAYAIFGQAIGLPLWFIAGGITPVQSLPTWLQPLSTFDPLTYANIINRAVVMQGVIPLGQFLESIGVIIAFTLVLTLISFRMFKSTIE
ncbi:MAG: ABC transporter permease [Candidatus Micrarchaeota archaeon]|nr:ABC transporter permease [Candidatus Micrarchaeota archaeon]